MYRVFCSLPLLIFLLFSQFMSCSNNVMQEVVFSDGFRELPVGETPVKSPPCPAVYYTPERYHLGDWYAATSLREQGFADAWRIESDGSSHYLAQTFSNLNGQYEPLSLITHPIITAGDTLWQDYTVEFEFTPLGKFDKCGLAFRYRNPNQFYFFGIEGNAVVIKLIQESEAPLRPLERILDMESYIWTPGETFHAVVSVRQDKIFTLLNDSISLHAKDPTYASGKIGLLSDMPARFNSVQVKILNGEQRRLNRRKRQILKKRELRLSDHPLPVKWKQIDLEGLGAGQNLRLGDLNGDGNKEILVIQTSPGPPGSGPAIRLLTALSLSGDILWQNGKAGSSTTYPEEVPVEIHDLDGDGDREVLYIQGRSLVELEGSNGRLIRKVEMPVRDSVKSLVFADLLGIGRANCLILSDRETWVTALDEKLRVLWTYTLTRGSQPVVYDLDNDSREEVLIGFSVIDDTGEQMFDVGRYIGDDCNGMVPCELMEGETVLPCILYAAGDWGLMYYDLDGNLIRQQAVGHVEYVTVADLDMEKPGLEVVSSNSWGSNGLIHLLDASGRITGNRMPETGTSRVEPVNWKGDGEEFFILDADTLNGGLYDVRGDLAVAWPSDGHPVRCYLVQDLTGDARDELLFWDEHQLWIYTQYDNPRMGKTYEPHRLPLYNQSMLRMNLSVPSP